MAAVAWTEEEDIALCESWVGALSHHTPGRRSSGPFCRTIRQHFQAYIGENNRTVDPLSSRFRRTRLDCERFETIHTAVEHEGGDLEEDDIIQVALINFRHEQHREFTLRSAWEIIYFSVMYLFIY
ncbi:hypothetical protein Hanom_Chr10g00916661 [Helianthus anomalus]